MLRALVASILVAATTLGLAQSPQLPDYKLSVHVELVELPVSVLDKKGHPVRGLREEHFKIYEDRVMQDIALFKQEDVPVSIGLVIDASSSMRDKQDRVSAAAYTFVQESNPEDESFVLSFGDQPILEQDFTRNSRKLNHSLQQITTRGNTALYDAVLLAAQHLEERAAHDKKVLLVVSDGEDNKSQYKLDQVLEKIRESKILVYTVGLLSADINFMYAGPFQGKAKKALKEFAEVTGGRAFFPGSVNDVDEVCKRIARDLRNQYTIAYRPTNENLDGSWRKINVQVDAPKGSPKVSVHTKRGYYAPSLPESQVEATNTTRR